VLKTIIGGISGGIVVFLIIIFFPIEIETIQETIQKESKHPCQKIVLEIYELQEQLTTNAKYNVQSPSDESYQKIYAEWMKSFEQAEQIYEQYNCVDDKNWLTSEFREEIGLLTEKYN